MVWVPVINTRYVWALVRHKRGGGRLGHKGGGGREGGLGIRRGREGGLGIREGEGGSLGIREGGRLGHKEGREAWA